MVKTKEIDEIDKKILGELVNNARQSAREIAKNAKTSIVTVIKRTKRMEKENVINGYTALVDAEKLGYDITAIIELTVSKGKLIQIENEIAQMENVCGVYDITGESDAVIVTKFRNRKELDSFIKGLLAMPHIERTNTHLVLNTVKEDFRPRGILKV